MVVWSCLKSFKNLSTLGSAFASVKNVSKIKTVYYFPVRGSHDRTIDIQNSRYPLAKAKDLCIFYLMLGIIPLLGIVTYVNIFIGPAELALIPEGYEPKHWEYYRHPITRFFARYVMMSPQERYERNLHNVFIDAEISEIKRLKLKINEKMRERLDYQSWYYLKPETKYFRKLAEDQEEQLKEENSEISIMPD